MIGDYPRPITVNGFKCKNCSDVDKAKKNIDPEHPEDGPFGVYKKKDEFGIAEHAVVFGGALAHLSPPIPAGDATKSRDALSRPRTTGGRLDISV